MEYEARVLRRLNDIEHSIEQLKDAAVVTEKDLSFAGSRKNQDLDRFISRYSQKAEAATDKVVRALVRAKVQASN